MLKVMPSNHSGIRIGYLAGRYPNRLGWLISPGGWRTPPDWMTYNRCPECGSEELYGPVSDYWGCCCVNCGHEIAECAATKIREGVSNLAVYLCGPINGCTDSECKHWRTRAKQIFPNAIDQMRREYRGWEDDCISEIVGLDKADIVACDAVLANCPKPSVGTSMEIFFAWTLGKRVVSVVPDRNTASPWLLYHSDAVVETLAEAFQTLKR